MNKKAKELAADPATSPEILKNLSNSESQEIVELVANNPNTPINVLWFLIQECSQQVLNNPIIMLITLEHPNWIMEIPISCLKIALLKPDVPEILVEEAMKHESLQLRRLVFEAEARNPRTSVLKLEKMLINNGDLMPQALRNPNFTLDLLWKLVSIAYDCPEFLENFSSKLFSARNQLLERFTWDEISDVQFELLKFSQQKSVGSDGTVGRT